VPNLETYEVHSDVGESSLDGRQFLASVVLHLSLIALVMLWPKAGGQDALTEQPEDGQVVALDPQAEFRGQPQQLAPPPPAPPTVPDEPIPLGPDSDRPDDPPRDPIDEATEDTPVPELLPEELPPATDAQDDERMERIPTPEDLSNSGTVLGAPTSPFSSTNRSSDGPPPVGNSSAPAAGVMGRTGLSQGDNRGWRSSAPQTGAGQCVEIPDFGVNPDGSPVLASVIGVVRDQRGRPLPGAHLQIVGAPFATFADGSGNYRLEFDPKLLVKCRSQVVRVSSVGYRDASLNLAIGRRVESDDVIMRRR
jgi:hypothetical protein